MLHRFFTELETEKDRIIKSWDSDIEQDQNDPAVEAKWLDFLDDEAVDWFTNTFNFNSDEEKTYQELWKLTAPEIRLSHPMFKLPGNWHFESMLDALFNGDYVFVDLVQESETNGVLYYDPLAWPFGGSESLVALIESFGHTVTFDSWHKGPHRRRTVGWDYALAKRLVAAGKGFTLN